MKRLTLPKKGTQLRAVMLLMLRRQGATTMELKTMAGSKGAASVHVASIVDYLGFDVRRFPNRDRSRGGTAVYKIVGRDRRNGKYRAFGFNTE